MTEEKADAFDSHYKRKKIMAVTVLIPTALRGFTERNSELSVEGASVREALNDLTATYPDIKQHLYKDGEDELRSFINVFVGESNIKKLQGLDTTINSGETIMLVPAIAGGDAS
jgi:adenylyltransferase/sulfurtransferase